MNIGVLGAGNMATALGRIWAQRGHEVMVSFSRDDRKLASAALAIGPGAKTGSAAQAAQFADVVVLATVWGASQDAIAAAGRLTGKIVFSIVNPLRPDMAGLEVGTTTSGNEELARAAHDARWVAGWPPFAEVLSSGSTRFGDERSSLFYCGDDGEAKARVRPLLDALDVAPVDAGPLQAARFIEPAMMLLVHLAYRDKLGEVGLRLLRRSATTGKGP
jgi:8-hydroxy-5-deazaflavin:NADPH oxidoreductase